MGGNQRDNKSGDNLDHDIQNPIYISEAKVVTRGAVPFRSAREEDTPQIPESDLNDTVLNHYEGNLMTEEQQAQNRLRSAVQDQLSNLQPSEDFVANPLAPEYGNSSSDRTHQLQKVNKNAPNTTQQINSIS